MKIGPSQNFYQMVSQITVDMKNKLTKSLNKSRDAIKTTPKASTSSIVIKKLTSTQTPSSPLSRQALTLVL